MDSILKIAPVVASFISAIAALFALVIAQKHLKNISKEVAISVTNQRIESLKVVLDIETQMNSRKLEFDKASKQVREAEVRGDSDETCEIFSDFFEATKESYFNSLDRLCFCIDKEYIQDKDWRVEYRNLLKDVVSEFTDDFNEASPYNNIKKINDLWQTT